MTSAAAALDLEIGLLRERLADAEDMRRAITAGEVDGFVVGAGTSERVVLLETAVRRAPYGNARLPCVTVSRSGHILYANHGFSKLIDRGLRELYSAPLEELVTAAHHERLRQFLDAPAPDAALEVELTTGHGTLLPTRLVTVDVGHGFASLLVIDTLDDVRLQEAELAIDAIAKGEVDAIVVGGTRVVLVHDADQSYRELIDRMDQGAASISRLGLVQNVNEPLAAMLGRQRHELLGTDFFTLLREQPPRLAAMVADAGNSGPLLYEVSLARSDGSAIPVEIALVPAQDDDPVTLVVTDLTERRRHQRIEEETRRKDEFLAVLAHELRNPLASIRTCVEILHRSASLGTNERQSVQIMGRQTSTLVRLVDDLLDIHRLNEGKIAMRRQPVTLQEVVHDATEAAGPYVSSKHLDVQLVVPAQPVHAIGDKVRLTQVLLNLLANAAKFTAIGGHIEVRLEPLEHGRARITVTDDGCGIAPELLEKVFEPYVQVSGQGDSTATGLGLGLSVARRLVDLHGGSIRAESDGHGAGSRFILELPIVAAPAVRAQTAVASAPAATPSTALRVLVVDDSRDAAESLAMLVRLAGHDVLTAYDGRSAVRLGADYRPDLVFLDIGMPGFDGFSTAQLLREQSWGRDVLVCALTGYGQHGLESRIGPDARFDRRFVKPMDPAALSRLLHEATTARTRHGTAVR